MAPRGSGGVAAWRSHLESVFGQERAAAVEEALKQPPRLFCRIANQTAECAAHERLFLPPSTYISASPYAQNETEYFLDPASVFPVVALNVQPQHSVLDMCAAPGGKSLLIASQLFEKDTEIGQVQLVANDLSQARLGRLQRTIKQHYPNAHGKIQVVASDPRKSLSVTGRYGPYDRILIDAPCSSDQHKLLSDALTEWRISIPKRAAEVQSKLLLSGCELLKNGGRLVYSTCALSSLENTEVVSKVLSKLSHFRVESHEAVEALIDAKLATDANRDKSAIKLERLSIGHIILPDTAEGSGPIYFAVIVKEPR